MQTRRPNVTARPRYVTRSRREPAKTPQHAHSPTADADISFMNTIQVIDLHGRPAALVIAGAAIIDTHVPHELLAHVQAKALYALQIEAGERPGPYRDTDAEHYARRAAAAIGAPPTRPRRRRPRRDAHRRRPLQP
jgi:hypothetical protein